MYQGIYTLTKNRYDQIVEAATADYKRYYSNFTAGPNLKGLGFEVKVLGLRKGITCSELFYHPEWKIIVKISNLIPNCKPERGVPTISFKVGGQHIIIQPFVDSTSKRAMTRVTKEIENYRGGISCIANPDLYGWDAHYKNLGLYRGKVVAFDW